MVINILLIAAYALQSVELIVALILIKLWLRKKIEIKNPEINESYSVISDWILNMVLINLCAYVILMIA